MRRVVAFIAVSLLLTEPLVAQCSDAGVCAIGSGGNQPSHILGARYVFGSSGNPDNLTVHSVEVEGSVSLSSSATISIHVPWVRISGPGGAVNGVGDITALWSQRVLDSPAGILFAQVGTRVATGKSNVANLPQAYQPGLGTNDLLLGVSYETDPWTFAIGYQLSRGRSDNAVTRLKRGDDLLARVGFQTRIDTLAVGLEVLGIKRLQRSSVLDARTPGNETFIEVPESDQFQINLLGTIRFPVSERITLRGSIAVPVLERKVNIDGLKRSLTLSAGVQIAL
ncbi:MAG: hypothetical protein IT282_09230 [Bacteroidetes bacterium]|nr:hypothetical protein [Bacteroidota bacterium]